MFVVGPSRRCQKVPENSQHPRLLHCGDTRWRGHPHASRSSRTVFARRERDCQAGPYRMRYQPGATYHTEEKKESCISYLKTLLFHRSANYSARMADCEGQQVFRGLCEKGRQTDKRLKRFVKAYGDRTHIGDACREHLARADQNGGLTPF